MAETVFHLGDTELLTKLYSYPNDLKNPGAETLAQTIEHWFNQTLDRDGFTAQGATAQVVVEGDNYKLSISGPGDYSGYAERLPEFLRHGLHALNVVKELETMQKDPPWPEGICDPKYKCDVNALWDPQGTGQWRFFMPHGLAMLNQRSLQFFHYPPMRLLDAMRDYLDDPVPVRLTELLVANGVTCDQEAYLYETVMDGAPVAAPDNQGTVYYEEGVEPAHLIPIESFGEYQRAQVKLLLNTSAVNEDYTVPVIVYGGPARSVFEKLFGAHLVIGTAVTVEIIPGKKTPVIGAHHPYRFYAQGQIDRDTGSEVGCGHILPEKCAGVVELMKSDCAVARWQVRMAADPTQDPVAVFQECSDYWAHPDRAAKLCELVQHQGSLYYPNPDSTDPIEKLKFTFKLDSTQAAEFCTKHGNNPCAS